MPCDMIKWPDFSALQVLLLELGSKERNWKLGRLLHQLSLISLSIVSDMDVQSSLVTEDCMAIEHFLLNSSGLKEFYYHSYKAVEGVEGLAMALARNRSLPLKRLSVGEKCTLTDAATEYLTQFITNTTSLESLHLTMSGTSTCSARACLLLIKCLDRNTTLQDHNLDERKLIVTVCCDKEANDLAQLLEYCNNTSGINWTNLEITVLEHLNFLWPFITTLPCGS